MRRTRRWLATLLAALLAISWQSVVTQAHVHPEPTAGPTVGAPSGGEARLQAKAPSSDSSATCPICRELAQAGRYISPGAFVWRAPEASALGLSASFLLRREGHERSHAWNSRAPPSLRQA